MREQFLVEITGQTTNTSTGGQPGRHQVADLIELNRLFTAWVETVYHRQTHSETGAPPLARWQAAAPFPLPTPAALAEAFLWEQRRTVTKTATVSLHGNTYQVEAALTGRKVELVFSPFNLQVIEVRHGEHSYGHAVPYQITRHAHPKARPETPEPAPAPATGIAYLQLVANAHQQQVIADERIDFHALYSSAPEQTPEQSPLDDPTGDAPTAPEPVGDLPAHDEPGREVSR
ncbi:MAG: Mu transposase C-terminal domain-containing protein [Pseudonocardiaceae bacterium]